MMRFVQGISALSGDGRLRQRLLLGCAAAATTVALAACGSSEPKRTAPAAYVSQVCTSISNLLQTTMADEKQLAATAAHASSPTDVKAAVQRLVAGALTAAEQTVSELKAAGVPDVANGKQISTRLIAAFEKAVTLYKQASQKAAALPTNSPEAFSKEDHQLGSFLENSAGSIGSSLGQIQSRQLGEAAAKSPACQALDRLGNGAS